MYLFASAINLAQIYRSHFLNILVTTWCFWVQIIFNVWFFSQITVQSLIKEALRSPDNFPFDRLHINTNVRWHPYQQLKFRLVQP